MIHGFSKFFIFGHRGACGYEPENSISSFKRALEMGVDGIELDVHVCATGELVVIHDDTVDRTTNGHGNVADMSFSSLRKLLVEGKTRIPSLDEVIDFVNRKVPLIIELKSIGVAEPLAKLLNSYLATGWSQDDFVVSSFYLSELAVFKHLCPKIQIGGLFEGAEHTQDDISILAKKAQVSFVGLDVFMVSKEMVEKLRNDGFLVFAWTVNDKTTADRMRKLGLDGIFSNYPDKVA